MTTKILIVEDKDDARRNLVWAAKPFGEVGVAGSAQEAISLIEGTHYDVVVTDLKMEAPYSGLDVLRAAKQRDPHTQVLIITAFGSPEVSVRAMREGAFDYMERNAPGSDMLEMLRHKIRLALDYRSLLIQGGVRG